MHWEQTGERMAVFGHITLKVVKKSSDPLAEIENNCYRQLSHTDMDKQYIALTTQDVPFINYAS